MARQFVGLDLGTAHTPHPDAGGRRDPAIPICRCH